MPAAAQVTLGSTVGSFGVLGGSTVTNTGSTIVNGNLGVSPGSSVTGFPPGVVVGGTIHSNDATAIQAQTESKLPAIKTQLGPLLNGFINFDYWLPIEKMTFPGVSEFLARYQGRAQHEGVFIDGVTARGSEVMPGAGEGAERDANNQNSQNEPGMSAGIKEIKNRGRERGGQGGA